MKRYVLPLVCVVACADDPAVLQAPVAPPASVTEALSLGLSLADVTLRASAATRNVAASADAIVSLQGWTADVARRRQPTGAAPLAATATLDLHLSVSQYASDRSLRGTLTDAFDGRAARAAFQPGRRLLVAVAPDELVSGAWRVWHAWAVSADAALAEPALGLSNGTSLDRVLAE